MIEWNGTSKQFSVIFCCDFISDNNINYQFQFLLFSVFIKKLFISTIARQTRLFELLIETNDSITERWTALTILLQPKWPASFANRYFIWDWFWSMISRVQAAHFKWFLMPANPSSLVHHITNNNFLPGKLVSKKPVLTISDTNGFKVSRESTELKAWMI